MRTLELSRGMKVIVDDEDYEKVSPYKWSFLAFHNNSAKGYAHRRFKGEHGYVSMKMHRFILNVPKGMEVDHINGDGLDNRRTNMRICTHAQNVKNASVRKDNTSGVKGVNWNKRQKKWVARINLNKRIQLGSFDTFDDAKEAYNRAAEYYYKDFAKINT